MLMATAQRSTSNTQCRAAVVSLVGVAIALDLAIVILSEAKDLTRGRAITPRQLVRSAMIGGLRRRLRGSA
jgi:hypothetical protein